MKIFKKSKSLKGNDKKAKDAVSSGQLDALSLGRVLVAGGGEYSRCRERNASHARFSPFRQVQLHECIQAVGGWAIRRFGLEAYASFRQVRACLLLCWAPLTALDCASVCDEANF